jgi:adenosylhomocysteinase
MNAASETKNFADYQVADLALADWGRKEIAIAQTEMPGLMAIREEFAAEQPLRGARDRGLAAHDDPDRRADRDAAGARRRRPLGVVQHLFDAGPCGGRHRRRGTPVFAYKGETLAEYWDYTHRIFEWTRRTRRGPNMILDDGGDATLLVHLGTQAEAIRRASAHPANEEETRCSRRSRRSSPRIRSSIRASRPASRASPKRRPPASSGSTRCTRKASWASRHQRQRLGDQVEVRQPVRLPRIAGRRHQARDRRDDRRQGRAGGGYGDVGKGSAQALRALSAQVWIAEIDPICALQAAMEGYRVVTIDYAADKADIFVTATGNIDIITHEHMKRMKNQAIVCNIGHFDNEIDVAALKQYTWENIKPQVDHIIFPDGKRIILLAEGGS